MLLKHWRVDHDHSNSYTAWQKMGSPQNPSTAQYQSLQGAGQLQLMDSPRWVAAERDAIDLTFSEPVEGVSLLDLSW
jgi:xylan 1,4-beta-xylosidase